MATSALAATVSASAPFRSIPFCSRRLSASPALDARRRVAHATSMRLRVGALLALIAVVAGLVAIGGWWYVKPRERIGRADIQTTVASKAGGTSAMCIKPDANA